MAVTKACPDSKPREDGRFRRNADSRQSVSPPDTDRSQGSFVASLSRLDGLCKSRKRALKGVGEKLGLAENWLDLKGIYSRAMVNVVEQLEVDVTPALLEIDGDEGDSDEDEQNKKHLGRAMKELACVLRELSQRMFASPSGGNAQHRDIRNLRLLSPEVFDVLYFLFLRDASTAALHHLHNFNHALVCILDKWSTPEGIPGDDQPFEARFWRGGKPTPTEVWQFVQQTWPHTFTGENAHRQRHDMPVICVKRVPDPAVAQGTSIGQQCGLFAGEDIQPGRVITGYGGMGIRPGKVVKDWLKKTVSQRLLRVLGFTGV